jgi:glutaredoxin 3
LYQKRRVSLVLGSGASNMQDVKVITAEWCDYCTAAKKLLDEKGIVYEEIDVMDAFSIMSQNQLTTIPQIFMEDVLIPGGYEGLKGYLNAN